MGLTQKLTLFATNFKGYYATEAALNTAYSTAVNGDFAIVGTTDTVWCWDGDTSAWVDSGSGGIVTSVFSRIGDVIAQNNDYTWAQIDKTISDIADIATKSHTSLTDIGSNTHAQLDSFLSTLDSVSGIVKCDGAGNYSAATAGTDYYNASSQVDHNSTTNYDAAEHRKTLILEKIINGNGFAITTGYKGHITVPVTGTITAYYAEADQSTTTTIDLWKCSYADYDAGSTHPVDGDSITSAAPVSISSAVKGTDSTLTGWTTSVSEGDKIGINVDANDNAEKINISLAITRT